MVHHLLLRSGAETIKYRRRPPIRTSKPSCRGTSRPPSNGACWTLTAKQLGRQESTYRCPCRPQPCTPQLGEEADLQGIAPEG
jgi:hypothetical protein